jgi:hypothetical protein
MERFSIGKTRNGVTVSSQTHSDGVTSPDDMFDTWAILEAFCVRELRMNGNTELFDDLFSQSSHWHKGLIRDSQLTKIEKNLNVQSYAARIEFGKRLLNIEFRD